MTVFWLGAGVMIVAALGWILPALWSREALGQPSRDDHVVAAYEARLAELESDYDEGVIDADQLEVARDELAAELVADVRDDGAEAVGPSRATLSAVAVTVTLAALSVGFYEVYGTPEGMAVAGKGPTRAQAMAAHDAAAGGGAAQAAAQPGQGVASIEQMVESLAKRLADEPEDGTGWMMLGRSYQVMGRLQEAEQALTRALELLPNSADALSAYAEVLGRQSNNQLNGKPLEYLTRALEVTPNHPKSLWLSGIAAMQRGDRPGAVQLWRKLRETGALNAEETASLDQMIADAGGPPAPVAPASATAAATTAAPAASAPASRPAADGAGVRLTVTVSLDDSLADRVKPGDSLFVFARAAKGPPMPLAVQRLTAADLPATVVLDESMAMMPQLTLGTFPQVVVGARISRSGNATPSAGDLQGLSEALAPADTDTVSIVIRDAI